MARQLSITIAKRVLTKNNGRQTLKKNIEMANDLVDNQFVVRKTKEEIADLLEQDAN